MPWRARRLGVLIGAAAVLATGASGTAEASRVAGASRAAGVSRVTGAPACPVTHDETTVMSHRPGAADALVPAGVVGVRICRYNGLPEPGSRLPGFGLIGAANVGGGGAARLAGEFNALPNQPRYPIPFARFACPVDTGTSIVAWFRYPSGALNPVTVTTEGCASASNGTTFRETTTQILHALTSLTRSSKRFVASHNALLSGTVRNCGGTPPGRCVAAGGSSDTVDVYDGAGTWVGQASLAHGGFSTYVPPGRLTVELLDGNDTDGNPDVLQTQRITARAGRRVRVAFVLAVP